MYTPRPRRLFSADRKLVLINLGAVLLPFAGLAATIILNWGSGLNWWLVGILLLMSAVSGLGVTIGYHRLCTHKSFKTPAIFRYLFAAAGSMAVQGPVIRWCAEHRKHHQHSDDVDDPHSPHMSADGSWGEGIWAITRGAFHAHVGWLFTPRTRGLGKYSQDLRRDRALVLADRQFLLWVGIGLVFPGVLAGLIMHSWAGVLLGFLWGGLVRVLLVHHVTWSVNSVCHLWGTRPFESHDESRNNPFVALFAMGEGWHNNHHAFPTSARHGLRWWEFDLSYLIIRMMQAVGLASDVRLPDLARIASKKRVKDPLLPHAVVVVAVPAT